GLCYCISFYYFFFQAEDGIRDDLVTGVQTCALPISTRTRCASASWPLRWSGFSAAVLRCSTPPLTLKWAALISQDGCGGTHPCARRGAVKPVHRAVRAAFMSRKRAGDRIRTGDVQLGKLAFYP